MKATLKKDLSITAYHNEKTYLSKSMLSDILPPNCPQYFHWKHIAGNDNGETKSLRLGSAVHVLALEPNLFKEQFFVTRAKPDGSDLRRGTKAWEELEFAAAGRTILKSSEFSQIKGMADALKADKISLKLLKAKGLIESSIFWEEENQKFRCRPDLMREDGLIVDLKTCRSVHPETFFKDSWNMHYALSVALTCRGYKALYEKEASNYVFLCVTSEEPFMVAAFDAFRPFDAFGTNYRDAGEKLLQIAVEKYKECKSNDNWPGYHTKIEPMGIPRFAQKFIDTGEL